MPRDGSNVYSKASASFVTGTAISSASVNSDFDDLVVDANTVRPIVAGGTGAATVIAANDALQTQGADIASAATLVLTTATGPMTDITGTTTVTAVTLTAGKQRMARATGAFILTASATLVVNRSTTVNYTTTAGDLLIFEGYAGVVYVWVVSATISDATKANIASPTFTGVPAAPTAAAATNTTQLATTAFVQQEITAKAPLASPTFTGAPAAPTAAAATNTTQIATTAFVQTAVAGFASATYDAVNSYLFASSATGGTTPNSTVAGSTLTPAGTDTAGNISTNGGARSGTWRCMGYLPAGSGATLWTRTA